MEWSRAGRGQLKVDWDGWASVVSHVSKARCGAPFSIFAGESDPGHRQRLCLLKALQAGGHAAMLAPAPAHRKGRDERGTASLESATARPGHLPILDSLQPRLYKRESVKDVPRQCVKDVMRLNKARCGAPTPGVMGKIRPGPPTPDANKPPRKAAYGMLRFVRRYVATLIWIVSSFVARFLIRTRSS
jgi:hypothetical protein